MFYLWLQRLASCQVPLHETSRSKCTASIFLSDGTISLARWPYLPGAELFKEEPFLSLIDVEPGASGDMSTLKPQDFASAMEQRIRKITDVIFILKLLPEGTANRPLSSKTVDPGVDRLRLVTSVFTCSGCPDLLFFGQDDVLSHHCSEPQWEFSSKGSKAIKATIALVRLDVNKCTAADLDALNAWFHCLSCPEYLTFKVSQTKGQKIQGKMVYSWRNCVSFIAPPTYVWSQ